MRKYLTILFVCLLPFISKAQTANAGADQTIYLTQGNSATLDGSASSGTSFQWREVSTDYMSGGTITSPTSKTTTINGLKQGTFYFEIAVTTGVSTTKDTTVIRVSYNPPPSNSSKLIDFDMVGNASIINNRFDTLTYFQNGSAPYNQSTFNGIIYYFDRDRLPGLMIDSLRGKLYSTIQDGYMSTDGYSRSEIELSQSTLKVDTTKTYMVEWIGYYPNETDWLTTGDMLTMMQIHGDLNPNPFGIYLYPAGVLNVGDYGTSGYLSPTPISTFSNFVNQAHTMRMTVKEGMGYPNQDGFIKIDIDGVQKYYRDTGNIGLTTFNDYLKFGGLYDFGRNMVNGDSLSRGRKFQLVTNSYKVYQLNDAVPPPLINPGTQQILFTPTTSTTLVGSVDNTTASSYLWAQVSGNTATITSSTSATTTVTGLSAGSYTFRLTATNSLGVSGSADVSVVVYPDPTIQMTGYNYDVIVDGVLNGTVSSLRNHDLDGSGFSFYADGFSVNSTKYNYGLPSNGKLISSTNTIYQLQSYNANNALWLNTGQSGTLTISTPANYDTIKVAVTSGGSSVNYTIHYSDATTGTGTFSVPNWGCAGCTIGAATNLGRTDASGFESAGWAIYEGKIIPNPSKTVSSISFTSTGSWTSIFAASKSFVPPTISMGGDQNITVSNTTTSAIGIPHAGHTITDYQWTRTQGTGTITNPNSASTSITGMSNGVNKFQCTVTQDDGQTASATVNITVTLPTNVPPTANAGTDQTITLPTSQVTLTGSGTDSDGSIASYSWSKVSGGTATITSASAATTTITGLAAGVYIFRLTVTDNQGATGMDDVQITVNNVVQPPNAYIKLRVPTKFINK